ncbi:MAG TPA: thioredoxin domain-containing protein [Candidatus Angelobacter sp.]|nr:thioredoxin domain-containing protein [Candidatus Angelobacter sp.]
MRKAICVLILSVLAFAGGPQRVENKPLVAVIYADWCPLCQKLKPTLVLINDRYQGKIRFVLFDVTSEETMEKSRQQARSLGVEQFFDKNKETTSLVIIQDPSGREVFRAFHDYDFQHYAAVLDQQIRQPKNPISEPGK